MSNFRNTYDIVDGVLRRCGELTQSEGTSPYLSDALLYVNQIHHNLVLGGCELNIDVDEPWVWAKAKRPIILQLNPAITSGTCALTYGSVSGTFDTAPQQNGSNISVEGWHIRPNNNPEVYKIVAHASGSTSFQLDAPFPQLTNSALNFTLFQLDYDLISSSLIVDSENDKLDFIETGTTVRTATLTHGTYTPAGLATQVAAALNSTGVLGNIYSASYDSNQRFFTVSSNVSASASVFKQLGAGTNYYRSGWDLLGFDCLTYSGASSYTGSYPVSAIVRLSQAARIFFGSSVFYGQNSGQLTLVDPVAFDRTYPLYGIQAGAPDTFTIIREKNNYTLTIRLNKYPMATSGNECMRVEFEHIPEPKDLQNSTASIPLIPRKFIRILEYGAAYYLLTDKSDSKSANYLQIAQQTLQSMMKTNRKELEKVGKNFGAVVARWDLMPNQRPRRPNIYGYDAQE